MNMKPLVAFVLSVLVLPSLSSAAAKGKPAVLFCSPQGPAYGWVDLNYLDELHQHGFEVDYTESMTRPVDLAKSTMPVLENPFQRPGGERQPAIAAIRQYRGGRVALINQWRQFSIGSGTRFIFDRQVLSKGFGDRPSDFGRLLENIYRWLGEPSLKAGQPGGYVTGPDRLLAPNQNPKVKRDYAERVWPYDAAKLGLADPPPHLKLFRGLIGAKTTYSSGKSTVSEYAQAAAAAGLDFLVFLDDFTALTPDKLRSLKADCDRSSSGKLKLLPGFCIRNAEMKLPGLDLPAQSLSLQPGEYRVLM